MRAFVAQSKEGRLMPNQPRKDNPARSVRVPDALWAAAKERAAERDETVTDAILRALRRYVR